MYLTLFDTYKLHESWGVDATRERTIYLFTIGMTFDLDVCSFSKTNRKKHNHHGEDGRDFDSAFWILSFPSFLAFFLDVWCL